MRCIGLAHRGASADAPENTLAAFALALESGATGLESDVWVTADGVPVLDHDGLAPEGRAIRSCTRAEPRLWLCHWSWRVVAGGLGECRPELRRTSAAGARSDAKPSVASLEPERREWRSARRGPPRAERSQSGESRA